MSVASLASAGAGAGGPNHAGSGRPFLMDQVPVAAPAIEYDGFEHPAAPQDVMVVLGGNERLAGAVARA